MMIFCLTEKKKKRTFDDNPVLPDSMLSFDAVFGL